MENLTILIAVNGLVILLFSSLIGLVLAKSLHENRTSEHWHLLHAGGTSRGIMLMALAGVIQFVSLPAWHLYWASGLVTFFVWTSILAMALRAITGEKGFYSGGSLANRSVFWLYAGGAIALPTGLVWMAVGLISAIK